MLRRMGDMLKLIWWVVTGLFRSRASLEAEIMALRHQLIVLRRKAPKRLAISNFDRLVFTSLYRIVPDVLHALVIVKPETVIRWHRAGFRLFWRWRSWHRWRGQAKGAARNPPIDPCHEPGQPAVGCAPDPWRTPQARHRHWPDLGRQVHGKVQETPIARVEDVPPQSCRWDRLDGPLCRSDTLVSTALRLAHSISRPASNLMAGRDNTSDR